MITTYYEARCAFAFLPLAACAHSALVSYVDSAGYEARYLFLAFVTVDISLTQFKTSSAVEAIGCFTRRTGGKIDALRSVI